MRRRSKELQRSLRGRCDGHEQLRRMRKGVSELSVLHQRHLLELVLAETAAHRALRRPAV
jgi:hypothetical protein